MKKPALLLLAFFGLNANAQVGEKGRFYVDLVGGLGIYKTENIETFIVGNNTFKETEKDTAVNTYLSFGGEYGITNWFSAGVSLQKGNYLYDTDSDREYKDNTFHVLDLTGHLYFLNKQKFTFFGKMAVGYTNFRNEFDDGIFESKTYYNGSKITLGGGLKWLFVKGKVGLFLDYERNMYNYNLKRRIDNGADVALTGYAANLKVRGGEFRIGISAKI